MLLATGQQLVIIQCAFGHSWRKLVAIIRHFQWIINWIKFCTDSVTAQPGSIVKVNQMVILQNCLDLVLSELLSLNITIEAKYSFQCDKYTM